MFKFSIRKGGDNILQLFFFNFDQIWKQFTRCSTYL
jgi:hypothetical protein